MLNGRYYYCDWHGWVNVTRPWFGETDKYKVMYPLDTPDDAKQDHTEAVYMWLIERPFWLYNRFDADDIMPSLEWRSE